VQLYSNAQAMHELHFSPTNAVEEPAGGDKAGARLVQGALSFKVLAETPISGAHLPPLCRESCWGMYMGLAVHQGLVQHAGNLKA